MIALLTATLLGYDDCVGRLAAKQGSGRPALIGGAVRVGAGSEKRFDDDKWPGLAKSYLAAQKSIGPTNWRSLFAEIAAAIHSSPEMDNPKRCFCRPTRSAGRGFTCCPEVRGQFQDRQFCSRCLVSDLSIISTVCQKNESRSVAFFATFQSFSAALTRASGYLALAHSARVND